jgi:hypothetical protein
VRPLHGAAGALAIAFGLALLVALNVVRPGGALPLYDGVIVEEPYRYVNPPPEHSGSPTSAQVVLQVGGGTSPAIVAATTEDPPQAQLITAAGAFVVGPDVTSVTATITPVAGSAAEQAAAIGNVYNLSVVDQAGNALNVSAGANVTVVLRAPAVNTGGASTFAVANWNGQSWQQVPTTPGAVIDMFTGRATSLGDFAVVTADSSSLQNLAVSWLGALLTIGAGAAAIGLLLWIRRRNSATVAPAAAAPPGPATRRRAKPKRKG